MLFVLSNQNVRILSFKENCLAKYKYRGCLKNNIYHPVSSLHAIFYMLSFNAIFILDIFYIKRVIHYSMTNS